MSTTELLLGALRARISPDDARWLDEAIERAARGTLTDLLQVYTGASRHLGEARLNLGPEVPGIEDVPFDGWTLEDAGRVVFLRARDSASTGAEGMALDAESCFEQGDTREQLSWLRGVALLPDPARYLQLVIDACRTNILPLFEAVACENPYPAKYFPERNFNQLVLKALFNGVALARIVGLATRANPELARMANDYAAERRAAGRSVPADISLAAVDAARQRTAG